MQVLFDLQEEINDLDLKASKHIVPVGSKMPTLKICEVDGIKTLKIKDRVDQIAGIGIPLDSLPVKPGDRITVTGRVAGGVSMGSWGVALSIEETNMRQAEECQLAQFTSPKSLFSLSYILTDADLGCVITVQTTRWGSINPTMDLYVDSILILRDKKVITVKEDPRSIVYTMENDQDIIPGGAIAAEGSGHNELFTEFLAHSGSPDVKVFLHDDKTKALYVSRRRKDWDGVDIRIKNLELMKGNNYRITVEGSIDGKAPEGTIITLQGLPGYTWRNNQLVNDSQSFTLRYSLTQTEIHQWHTVRITTNAIGAGVSFYIYSIEIKRLGLL
ncbi:MAG: hypothetical protein FWB80_08030 [Defluviitaleaceae bacterium]|nr:hypothetical protein [Defluviitaleaceae bacterium]